MKIPVSRHLFDPELLPGPDLVAAFEIQHALCQANLQR